MTPEQWSQVKDVFGAALACPPDERDRHVDQACAENADLQREVRRLLDLHDGAEQFLEPPDAPAATQTGSLVGRRVGRYTIRRLIAAGGMGVVYEARQDHPGRAVALKLLRQELASGSPRRRFEYEAEVLGRLEHPGIARIYEAGTYESPEGTRPFFALELVDGTSLTVWADRHDLSIRARLELLARVGDAVQHAHQKGVIHRDLKPANILVDDRGQPKILDFGVARATESDLRATTIQTGVGQLVGTVHYMSPEQVAGDPDRIDTRSDVYALGVIAYELLTGELPYPLADTPVPQALRLIEEFEPRPLGTRERHLRGDVETIVAKALEKERERRYQSAADFVADIRRFLRDEPILARPPTTFYHLRKFARRHRPLVAGVAMTILSLLVGLVLFIGQAQRARAEAAQTSAINEFLLKIFAAVDPLADGRDVKVAALVDEAAREIDETYVDRPVLEAAVRNEVGTIYHNLGMYEKAAAQFAIALDLRRRELGADHPETLKPLNNLGQAKMNLGHNDEALPLLREAAAGRQRRLGDEHPETLATMNNLANLLLVTGAVEEALAIMRRTLDIQTRVLGPAHQHTLTTMSNLGSVLRSSDELEEAESLHRIAHVRLRDTLGPQHVSTHLAASNLARTIKARGRLSEAETLYREAADGFEQSLGPDHRDTLIALSNLGQVLVSQERHADAEPMLQRAADGFFATLGTSERSGWLLLRMVARTQRAQDRLEDAAATFAQVIDGFATVFGDDHRRTWNARREMALCLRDAGHAERAEPILRDVVAARRRERGDEHRDTQIAWSEHAALLVALDRHADAAASLEELAEVIARDPESPSPRRAGYLVQLGRCLADLERYAEAESWLLEGFRRLESSAGMDDERTREAGRAIIRLYERWPRPDDAARWTERLGPR